MILAGAIAASATLLAAAPAGASTLGGTATITNPSNSQPLLSGGSATTFTVGLPAQAACTGDTANGGYHVYSYLVQAGTDVTTLSISGGIPSQGYGLFNSVGYYGPANTAINTGQIVGIPTNFSWAPLTQFLTPSQLLYSGGNSGVWEAGLLCANSAGTLTDYWNTEVTFSKAPADPNGFTWAAVPGLGTQGPEVPLPVLLPLIGGGAALVVLALRRRARGRMQPALVIG